MNLSIALNADLIVVKTLQMFFLEKKRKLSAL